MSSSESGNNLSPVNENQMDGSAYSRLTQPQECPNKARRSILLGLGGLASIAISNASWSENVQAIEFYSVRTCRCCLGWIKYMEANGFAVSVNWLESAPAVTQLKRKNNVPEELDGCHTALVDGYILEGHVAAEDIRKMLQNKPKIIGLSVPGMPQGSPGMEGPNPQSYETFVIPFDGDPWVFRSHPIT